MFGAAYGAHKASMDKFAADMAVDLKDYNVAALSIWMGPLLSERMKALIAADLETSVISRSRRQNSLATSFGLFITIQSSWR